MNTGRNILIGIVSVIGLVALILMSLLGRGCDTANKMADQTVFNASKHVWNLENFKKQYAAYNQHVSLYSTSKQRIKKLEEKNIFSGQSYDNAVTQSMGAEQMARNIASKYNAASNTDYQAVWKNVMVGSEPLPERLNPDQDLDL